MSFLKTSTDTKAGEIKEIDSVTFWRQLQGNLSLMKGLQKLMSIWGTMYQKVHKLLTKCYKRRRKIQAILKSGEIYPKAVLEQQ